MNCLVFTGHRSQIISTLIPFFTPFSYFPFSLFLSTTLVLCILSVTCDQRVRIASVHEGLGLVTDVVTDAVTDVLPVFICDQRLFHEFGVLSSVHPDVQRTTPSPVVRCISPVEEVLIAHRQRAQDAGLFHLAFLCSVFSTTSNRSTGVA